MTLKIQKDTHAYKKIIGYCFKGFRFSKNNKKTNGDISFTYFYYKKGGDMKICKAFGTGNMRQLVSY